MRYPALTIMLLCAIGPAAAQYGVGPTAKADKVEPSAAPTPSACQIGLASVAVFKLVPVLTGAGQCGAADAVLLESVILPDKAEVAVLPPATLRCEMAHAVAIWVREDLAPAARKLGAPLRGLDNFDSYECRSRNRIPGAMLSEHGRANALDVRAIKLADGKAIGLTDVNVAKDWREALRARTCARFATVLGPGSDGYHEEHVHLDLAERRGGYKMCEWEVREPVKQADNTEPQVDERAATKFTGPVPLPRPRPVTANVPFDIRPAIAKSACAGQVTNTDAVALRRVRRHQQLHACSASSIHSPFRLANQRYPPRL